MPSNISISNSNMAHSLNTYRSPERHYETDSDSENEYDYGNPAVNPIDVGGPSEASEVVGNWAMTWPLPIETAMVYDNDQSEDTLVTESVETNLELIEKMLKELQNGIPDDGRHEFTKNEVAELLYFPMGEDAAGDPMDSFKQSEIGVFMANSYPNLWTIKNPAPGTPPGKKQKQEQGEIREIPIKK